MPIARFGRYHLHRRRNAGRPECLDRFHGGIRRLRLRRALDVNSGSGLASEGGYLGYNATAEGTVTVDGPGSVWTGNGGIYAGYFGTGTLNVTNGGAVSSSIGFLGYNSGASGTVAVDGSGSTWSDAGGLFVGNYGAGTLKITNGGAVSVQGETRWALVRLLWARSTLAKWRVADDRLAICVAQPTDRHGHDHHGRVGQRCRPGF